MGMMGATRGRNRDGGVRFFFFEWRGRALGNVMSGENKVCEFFSDMVNGVSEVFLFFEKSEGKVLNTWLRLLLHREGWFLCHG